ncbi:LIC_13387 family protein [Lentzea sp. NPDC055074]
MPRTFRIGAWAWIATGVGHLAIMGVMALGDPDPAAARAAAAAEEVEFALGGVSRTLHEVDLGINLVMSVALVFGGLVCLVAAKEGPVPRALTGLGFATSLVLLGVSVVLLPSPPIVLFAVAALAFGHAFATRPVSAG